MLKQRQDEIDVQRDVAAREIQTTWNIYRNNKKAKTFMALMTQAKEFSFEDLLAAAGAEGEAAEGEDDVLATLAGLDHGLEEGTVDPVDDGNDNTTISTNTTIANDDTTTNDDDTSTSTNVITLLLLMMITLLLLLML